MVADDKDAVFQFTGLIRGPTRTAGPAMRVPEVSIHRPHTRPDGDNTYIQFADEKFQFTGLIRGPTRGRPGHVPLPWVSIHRPHTRPDAVL